MATAARVSAFAEPAFRRYFWSTCLSTLGTWVLRFLLGWSAWALTGTATWVGIVSAAMLLPTFLLSPVFGVVSDRINPRNGMLLTLLGQGLVAAAAGSAELLGVFGLGPLLLLLLAMVAGAITAAHQPLRLALLPLLVPRGVLPGAIGVSAIVFNSSRIIGPALGGWLLTRASAGTAFLVAAGLFAAGLLLLARIRLAPRAAAEAGSTLLGEMLAGLRFVRSHQGIRVILAFTLLNGLLGRTVIELLPAISGKLLTGDAGTLATLTATAGAGAIVGGLLLARRRNAGDGLLRLVVWSQVAGSLSLLPIAWAASTLRLGAIIFALSMAMTVAGIGSQALAQLSTTDAFRGRVMSLWVMVTMGAPALGALALGPAADRLGFPPILLAAALLVAGASIWLYQRDGARAL
ncbi:MFS transporter [Haliea sp. E1-2-M8]|uniref:MFS transporter n=1 Tax=Haliea sp. E1-2-M8 TaxID=3064706 RepID=UPI002719682D|nr:MFS transporter [Haliea sp. E1-2-M8]MDO8862790.1 MFS transporter [Haliea sp. E1-2-M8]